MAVKREYSCDLCGKCPKSLIGDPILIGLQWRGRDVAERVFDRTETVFDRQVWKDAERHICVKCLSTLQSFEPVCGGGFIGCNGGPKCQSDHK